MECNSNKKIVYVCIAHLDSTNSTYALEKVMQAKRRIEKIVFDRHVISGFIEFCFTVVFGCNI